MRYTLLRVSAQGLVLAQGHARRLSPAGPVASAAFVEFARDAAPGVWALWADEQGLRSETRPETALINGMAMQLATSPFAGQHGAFPKPASPCAYDALRTSGLTTLLTSADGSEIYEACRAAVIGWDGERIVCVPADRPRVWSVAETAIRGHLAVREAPLLVREALPLLLINAVKGTCTIDAPGRPAFPEKPLAQIRQLFTHLTSRTVS